MRCWNSIKLACVASVVLGMFLGWPALGKARAFPHTPSHSDADSIIESYEEYLRFVLEVARTDNPSHSKLLHNNYRKLLQYDRAMAARFLKGLRFEMDHKLALMGKSPQAVTSRHPEIRKWVSRFIRTWIREADENLFRAVAIRAAEKNRRSEN